MVVSYWESGLSAKATVVVCVHLMCMLTEVRCVCGSKPAIANKVSSHNKECHYRIGCPTQLLL